jgi:hypothetical protein
MFSLQKLMPKIVLNYFLPNFSEKNCATDFAKKNTQVFVKILVFILLKMS